MKLRTFFTILLAACIAFSEVSANQPPILQASISILPMSSLYGDRLQPGKKAILKLLIKNIGGKTSAIGRTLVRFTFPKILNAAEKKGSFETEPEALPPLNPGQEMEIVFKAQQQLPDLIEFLKNDWPMRIYEAVFKIGEEEFIIGTGTITYSAHYYAGPNKALPSSVPEDRSGI